MLPDLDITHAQAIRSGTNKAYRPGGTFDAVVRGGVVYARYIADLTATVVAP